MRRALTILIAILALAFAFGVGWTFASVNKSTFHALLNIMVAKQLMEPGAVQNRKVQSDALVMMEAAVLTLGDTRPYVFSPARRERIDRAIDDAGRMLASVPAEDLFVFPSRGVEADRQFNESRRSRVTQVVVAARERIAAKHQ